MIASVPVSEAPFDSMQKYKKCEQNKIVKYENTREFD